MSCWTESAWIARRTRSLSSSPMSDFVVRDARIFLSRRRFAEPRARARTGMSEAPSQQGPEVRAVRGGREPGRDRRRAKQAAKVRTLVASVRALVRSCDECAREAADDDMRRTACRAVCAAESGRPPQDLPPTRTPRSFGDGVPYSPSTRKPAGVKRFAFQASSVSAPVGCGR